MDNIDELTKTFVLNIRMWYGKWYPRLHIGWIEKIVKGLTTYRNLNNTNRENKS